MYNTNLYNQIFNRRQFRYLIAIISIIIAAQPYSSLLAQSTTSISGTVIDSDTQKPLVGANVFIEKSGFGATTDREGRFKISSVNDGIYTLTCSYIGYKKESIILTVRNGHSAFVEFKITTTILDFPQISVIGSGRVSLQRIPGSGTIISRAKLLNTKPLSGTEMFRQVLGVNVQDEEGLGLRTNISIRGLDPDRSRTILMLEDGVPVALAPYGEPEMYYTPPIDRMSSIEIVKGSGSILFGPQTIGGVINYITADPHLTPGGHLTLKSGQNGFLLTQAQFSKVYDESAMLLNILHKQADSIRDIFFRVTDVMAKMTVNINKSSQLGLKAGGYDEISNSTYVGLTQHLYDTNPHFNPVKDDRLKVRRYSVSATHRYRIRPNSELKTTFYAYQTTRNWQRQDYHYSDNGTEIIVDNSTGNRNRSFEVIGAEPRLRADYKIGNLRNELDTGLRVHYERAGEQRIDGETGNSSTGIIRGDELRIGKAISAFAQNRIYFHEKFIITPGLRIENFQYERHILRTRVKDEDGNQIPSNVDIRSNDTVFEIIPGIGVSFLPKDWLTTFAGAYRGFAPPRIKDAITISDGGTRAVSVQLDAERSLNLELGIRAEPFSYLFLEATLFSMDFENQIIPTSESGGAVTDLPSVNQGATQHNGVEMNVSVDFGQLLSTKSSVSVSVGYTHTNATFSKDRFINGENVKGLSLPYAPNDMVSLTVGFQNPDGVNVQLSGSIVGEQFADNVNTVEGSANGRTGLIPSYKVWNLSSHYQHKNFPMRLTFSIKNLFNRKYIASRRPEGIKPGLFRQMMVGLDYMF